jgi:hypothetical protein
MPDIFFKCGSCGNHLVADDAGAGQTIDCPDCNTPTTIPEISTTHQCPQYRQRLKFSPEMKGELVLMSGLSWRSSSARTALSRNLSKMRSGLG